MPIADFDDVPNLELWLEGRQLTGGPFNDGDPVATWNDASGNTRHATAGTAPTYQGNSINGEPGLRFLQSTVLNVPNFLTGFTAGEVFLVAKSFIDPPTGASIAGAILQRWGDNALPDHTPFTDGNFYVGWGSTARKTVGNPQSLVFRPHCFNIWTAANDWAFRLNGRTIFSTASNTVGFGSAAKLGFSDSVAHPGEVVAIVVYSRKLTAGERADVEALITSRYGIPMDVPRTVAAGNFSNGAIWSGGVVPTGQHVLIRHALTVDQSVSVQGVQIDEAVTVASGVTWTISGDTYSRKTLTLQGDSILRFNTGAGNNLRYFQGTGTGQTLSRIVTNGTSAANRARIEKTGTGTIWFDMPRVGAGSLPTNTTRWLVEHVDFVGIANPAGTRGIASNVAQDLSFIDCTFDGCASAPCMEVAAGNSNIRLKQSQWFNVVGAESCLYRSNNGTPVDPNNEDATTTVIDECSFEKPCTLGIFTGTLIRNSYFAQFSFGSNNSGTGSLIRGCFHNANHPALECTQVVRLYDSFLYQDHTFGNPHFMTADGIGLDYAGNLFEYPRPFLLDSGDIFKGNSKGGVYTRNLILPSISDGYPAGHLTNFNHASATPADNKVFHNSSPAGWFILLGEFGEVSEVYSEVRGNLVSSPASRPNDSRILYDLGAGVATHDVARGANCTHNAIHRSLQYTDPLNGNAVYMGYRHNFPSSGTPGANDLVDIDPQFVDYGRCLPKWSIYKGVFAGPVDPDNWTQQEITDAVDAAKTLLFNNPMLISTDLIPWIREGYRPQNELYRTAAHDGTTPGAIEMAPPPATRPDPRLNLQATPLGPDVLLEWDNPAGDTATVNKVWRQV